MSVVFSNQNMTYRVQTCRHLSYISGYKIEAAIIEPYLWPNFGKSSPYFFHFFLIVNTLSYSLFLQIIIYSTISVTVSGKRIITKKLRKWIAHTSSEAPTLCSGCFNFCFLTASGSSAAVSPAIAVNTLSTSSSISSSMSSESSAVSTASFTISSITPA